MNLKDYIKKLKNNLGSGDSVIADAETVAKKRQSKRDAGEKTEAGETKVQKTESGADKAKKPEASPEKGKKNSSKKLRWDARAIKDYYIGETARVTGEPRDKVKEMMELAKNEFGISYKNFFLYGFYDIQVEDYRAKYEVIRAEQKARREVREQNELAMNEAHLTNLVAVTGEDREVLRERIQNIKVPYDVSIEYYDVFRFWELTPEEQRTFFVKGDADKLNALYNRKPVVKKFFMNKDIFAVRFAEYLGRPVMPTAGLKLEEMIQTFGTSGKVMYKPLTASRGNGIEVFEYDESNADQVHETITRLPKGVVEGLIEQHPEMKKLSVQAVNTIRVVTILTKDPSIGIETDKVHIVYYGLRMACGDGYLDNLHSGGMIAGLDSETGIVQTPGIDFANHQHEIHPDTGTKIPGFQVPCFDQIKELVSRAGAGIEGYYGWDIAITPDGPVVVEINTNPGAGILQTPYSRQHKGMFHVVAPFLPEEEGKGRVNRG